MQDDGNSQGNVQDDVIDEEAIETLETLELELAATSKAIEKFLADFDEAEMASLSVQTPKSSAFMDDLVKQAREVALADSPTETAA